MVGQDTTAPAVFGALVRVVRQVANEGAQELRRHGLTPAQYQVLEILSDRPQAAQHHLAEHLGVTRGNVSQLVSKLEASGLLSRRRCGATDELQVTDAARRLLARVRPEHRRFLEERLQTLTGEDRRALTRLLDKIRN